MKPKSFLIPPPDYDTWHTIMHAYGVPDYEDTGGKLVSVTLPAGWIIWRHPDKQYPHSWYIYNEDCKKVGEFYYNDKMSFIMFDRNFIRMLNDLTCALQNKGRPKSLQEQCEE